MKAPWLTPRREGVLARHILSRPLAPPRKPEAQPLPEPSIAIPLELFDLIVVSAFANALAQESKVATSVAFALVEHTRALSPSTLDGILRLVDNELAFATDPLRAPKPGFDTGQWLGVLERLTEIKDERS